MADYSRDERVVLTLDAGGTNCRFSAMRGNRAVVAAVVLPSNGNDLERCLANLVAGFSRVREQCLQPPAAISFAFPGPADYVRGIIGDLPNLPAFRDGGVALGPMLEEHFGLPVFVNNDADLFTYGEAVVGFLPYVNGLLEKAGNVKRYKNLLGVTFGTGLGGGTVCDGKLLVGDNSMAGEVWLLRNKLRPRMNAEEGVSIRAVRRIYAERAEINLEEAPDPKTIFEIGEGRQPGNKAAALEAFRQLGEVAGDAMGQALTLVDGLAVIGGGLSGAWPLFLPALVAELNSTYVRPDGSEFRRLTALACNLEDAAQRKQFVEGAMREIAVPGSSRTVRYDPVPRIGVGISRLGTSAAIAIGAYAFALEKLDRD